LPDSQGRPARSSRACPGTRPGSRLGSRTSSRHLVGSKKRPFASPSFVSICPISFPSVTGKKTWNLRLSHGNVPRMPMNAKTSPQKPWIALAGKEARSRSAFHGSGMAGGAGNVDQGIVHFWSLHRSSISANPTKTNRPPIILPAVKPAGIARVDGT
jgi:hypothetical protein